MVDRITRIIGELDAWTQRRRITRVPRNAVVSFLDHNILNYAGAMAYFFVLSLFQLLVLSVVVASYFLGEGEARDFVVQFVAEGTPLDEQFIGDVIDSIIASRGAMSIVSVVFLLWGALGLFSALSNGISVVFDSVPRRGFIEDKLVGLLLMAVAGALAIASLLIGIATGLIQRLAERVELELPVGDSAVWVIGLVAPIILSFLAFWVVYRVVPNRRVTWGEVLPGAVAAIVLWTALRFGFTWYATNIANYDSAFGPISTGVSLIVLLYFTSVIILVGAEVARASALDDRPTEPAAADPRLLPVPVDPPPAPAPQASARSAIGRPILLAGVAIAGLVGVVIGRLSKRDEEY